MWLVIGGDYAADRADVVGIYNEHKDAVKAAQEAGYKVRDGQWFGCHITFIKVDNPVRMVWENRPFEGWRRCSRNVQSA